jgi:hypothetical protein
LDVERDSVFRSAPTGWMTQASKIQAFEAEWTTLVETLKECPVPELSSSRANYRILPSERRGRWTWQSAEHVDT